MERNYVIVKKAFEIKRRGTAIHPKESLSPIYFGKKFSVLLEYPHGGNKQTEAVVESLLISASEDNELFTFLLSELNPEDVPCDTKISILREIKWKFSCRNL